MDKAQSQGTTYQTFKKDFEKIVAERGWTGWTGEGSKGGRAWRARVIYETNLYTSYSAGRFQQMKEVANSRPYWRYRHSDAVTTPRPEHAAWNGKILRHDDPWWAAHAPPNGFGCKCYVETLAARDLKKLGIEPPTADAGKKMPFNGTVKHINKKTGEVIELPEGVDKGWDYQPGEKLCRRSGAAEEDGARDKLRQWKQEGGVIEKNGVDSSAEKRKGRVPVLDQVDPMTVDGLKTIFERLANNNPDWFPNGIREVKVSDLEDGTIASTDQAGEFSLSTRPLKGLQNQSPANVAQRALKRIKNNQSLTRQDEEMLCAIWHEVRHNMQPLFPGFEQGSPRKIMEAIHEVVTRQTFEDFAAELGFAPRHIKAIRQKGIGYQQEVKHFNFIAKEAGWFDEDDKLKPEIVKMLDRIDRFDPSGQPPGGRIVLDARRYLENAAERLAAALGNGKPEAAKKMEEYLRQMVDGSKMNAGFGEVVVKGVRRA